jgi:hypothetical protein
MRTYYSVIDFTLQNGYDTRSSEIFHPPHFYGDRPMRYATTALVSSLTGLSTTQLREWTNRRALVPADVPPAGKGSSAKFTWQTVLIIFVAMTLKSRFHLELQAHRGLFSELSHALRQASFVALWNKKLMVAAHGRWALVDASNTIDDEHDALYIQLNPHLEKLATGFALPPLASTAGQLDLFPAQAVEGKSQVAGRNIPVPKLEASQVYAHLKSA